MDSEPFDNTSVKSMDEEKYESDGISVDEEDTGMALVDDDELGGDDEAVDENVVSGGDDDDEDDDDEDDVEDEETTIVKRSSPNVVNQMSTNIQQLKSQLNLEEESFDDDDDEYGADDDDDEFDSEEDTDSDEEEDLEKFTEDRKQNILEKYHSDIILDNYEQISLLTTIVRDTYGNIIDNKHTTVPFLTKYEKARILGVRAKQLNSGSDPFIEVSPDIIDGHVIAEMELKEKAIPFILMRPIPNGKKEYWKLSDLEQLDY